MKFRFAVCDDEQNQTEYLKAEVTKWASQSGNLCEIRTCPSIEMKEMNGVELAKLVRSENEDINIVFITGYPDFISFG